MKFDIHHNDPQTDARTGTITTDHGEIKTPIFMPVGTVGSVKGVHQRELENDIKAEIILNNTYHYYLRPGLDVFKQVGGTHKFINWKKPILTDSGGYQVYSLGSSRKIKEEGVTFSSHIDGSKHFFSPENVMETQRIIGADFIMAFDECTPYPCEYNYAKRSMQMTHRWLDRCIKKFNETDDLHGYKQTLIPIVQGSTYSDLRKISAEVISSKDMPANAIGGLSVGEPAPEMYAMTHEVCQILPKDKPRYLMGVGTPANILESIALGVDMFDCVLPSRNARHGLIYTRNGIINIKNAKWKNDYSALDAENPCYASQEYSKAYVRHLFQGKELLAGQITTLHNLSFYLWLVKQARLKIEEGTFGQWKDSMVPQLERRL